MAYRGRMKPQLGPDRPSSRDTTSNSKYAGRDCGDLHIVSQQFRIEVPWRVCIDVVPSVRPFSLTVVKCSGRSSYFTTLIRSVAPILYLDMDPSS
jgi:hypothetical protein